jgi:hypothetical protein
LEGCYAHAETRPHVVKLAKAPVRTKPKGGRLSLQAISLAEQGHLNERGKPFSPKPVAVTLMGRAQ